MHKIILGNWKMHSLRKDAKELAGRIAAHTLPKDVQVALFPPVTALDIVTEALKGTEIALGAQDCSAEMQGAFTGDISAAMLKDAGCKYVLVGHSERRSQHGESDLLVKRKAQAAIKAGLIPVICVGENRLERESGIYMEVLKMQMEKSLPLLEHSDTYLIAYEPVWAIGTGKTPSAREISEVHKTIASWLDYATSGARTAILYGGSVKAASAKEILAADDVDGVLVGGASLDADEFGKIIKKRLMYTVLLVIHVMVTIALIIIILMQRSGSDGAGLSGNSSNSFMSGRAMASGATRATAVLATAFILMSLTLSWITAHNHVNAGSSILDKIDSSKPAATIPAQPKPEPAKPSVPRPE